MKRNEQKKIYQITQPRTSEDNNLPCPTCFLFPCRTAVGALSLFLTPFFGEVSPNNIHDFSACSLKIHESWC